MYLDPASARVPFSFPPKPLGAFLIRILIADDRELMRSALKLILAMRPSWKVCGEADDGRDAVTKASKLRPDLIILDFKMPFSDGIQAASEISTAMPSTPIIIYTLYKTAELESAAKTRRNSIRGRQRGRCSEFIIRD